MSLRTYPLIIHPAYLRYIEAGKPASPEDDELRPSDIPSHRPIIEDVYDIADYVGVSREIIRSASTFKQKHYRLFQIRKKSGGYRNIASPRTFLKVLQWWILDTVLSNVYVPEFVYGFIKGRSFIQNARAHIGCTHILNVDVKDFFPSIPEACVTRIFETLDYSTEVASGLSALVTLDSRLPQGAPTSPMLANLAFAEADVELKQLAEGAGLTYTRYADDLSFSSSVRIDNSVLAKVEAIVRFHNFLLNPENDSWVGASRSR